LSAAAKRIAIAEDILKQIKAKQYNIESGTWLNINPVDMEENLKNTTKAEMLQNVLLGGKHAVIMEAPPAKCTCCAVGAACASAIRLFNQDSLRGSPKYGYEIARYSEGIKILNKYFPLAQVDLMEAAFEMRTDTHHKHANQADIDDAVKFGEEYNYDTDRLVAICKNIIKNKGNFKP